MRLALILSGLVLCGVACVPLLQPVPPSGRMAAAMIALLWAGETSVFVGVVTRR